MKLLILVSSLDLTQPFSATPAWWQLMKALYEIGVEVIAAPYQGMAVESLWWRAEANPARWQGDLYKSARELARQATRSIKLTSQPLSAVRPASSNTATQSGEIEETQAERAQRLAARTLIAPLWYRHLSRVLARERDVDALLILTTPLNHLVGVPGALSRKYGIPAIYYDGDVPASLPTMRGFASGFRIYPGADLSEYDAFISNSAGGAETLRTMGARQVFTLYYGADPDVFSPVQATQDVDVFFYGHGREYREEWVEAMLAQPARALPDASFRVRGTNLGDLGRVENLPYLSFSKLREYACRAKINLCITRRAHAGVYASSSSRPFELASMGCCIVGNPYLGIEAWFEPGRELFIVHDADEAADRYRYLLAHEAERRAVGEAARARVLAEHTFKHRAHQLVQIIREVKG